MLRTAISDRMRLVVTGTAPAWRPCRGPGEQPQHGEDQRGADRPFGVLVSAPRQVGWRRDADPIGLGPGHGDPGSPARLLWTCMAGSLQWALLTARSLAAVACGSHRGYQAGHPEVFPYSAGTTRLWAGEGLLERDDELGVLGTLVAQAARLRMPSRASHPAHPQQLRLPNQRLLNRDANITYNEGNSVSGARERTVMHRTLPSPAGGCSRAERRISRDSRGQRS